MSDFQNHDYISRMKMRDDHISRAEAQRQVTRTKFGSGVAYPAIKTKKVDPEAKIPTKAHKSDAGWDMYALEDQHIAPKQRELVRTGISLEIPEGVVGLIWPRSGLAVKSGIDVFAGVVDSGYRGEVGVCLYNSSETPLDVKKGDRIAQILFQEIPNFKLEEATELDSTSRGQGGFGSSGS
tara:strand:- start:556 stop:1098 length:543 start_codon:yes stop_codon:yes gene_type:complete